MAITLQPILATNSFAATRTIINNNFTSISAALTALDEFLNSSNGELNVTSAFIERGTNPITTILMTCEASGVYGGNLTVNGIIGVTTTALTATTGVTVSGGDVILNSSSNKLRVDGKLELDGEIVHKDFGNSFIEAADPASYDPLNVSGTQAILSVTGVHTIMLDFTTYNGTTKDIISVELPTGSTTGQTLEIVVKAGAIAGVFLAKTNIANLTGAQKIDFSNSPHDFQSATLRWAGTSWILMNLFGATIGT